jgi:DNA polymerase-1
VTDFYYYGPADPDADKFLLYKELILDARPTTIAIDTETVSLVDRSPIGIGIAVNQDTSFYFPVDESGHNPYIPWFLLEDPSVLKIYHNATFDLDVIDMIAHNSGRREFNTTNMIDTSIIARMMLEPDVSLPFICWKVNKETTSASDILHMCHVTTFDKVPENEVAIHCCQDTQVTYALYNLWKDEYDKPYMSIEMQVVDILFRMGKVGLLIDQELRAKLEATFSKEREYYISLCEGFGFNPGSPQQVGYILAKRGVMLPFNRRKWGKPLSLNTDVSVLEFCADPLAAIVLKYRQVDKALGTYLRPLKYHPRAYTSFHLDAATGRVSSKAINLQNIPAADYERSLNIRNIFLPDSGAFTDFDYSQIELRVLANLSNDREMLRVYDNDLDIHQDTADFMGVDRKICKSVNFGMVYGATAQTLMETAKIPDLARCETLIRDWFRRYSGVQEWIYQQQKFGLYKQYIVTLFGRKIRMPVEEGDEESIKRKAVNYAIQGSAAEIMKRAMIKCRHLPMSLQVHDELVFDGSVSEQILSLGLDHIANFRTPITIKELDRWE